MFVVGDSNIQQVIGVFNSVADAKAAEAALSSPARQKCISETIQTYTGAHVLHSAGRIPLSDRKGKDESSLLSFRVEQAGTLSSHVDIAIVGHSRSVTEILFLTEKAVGPSQLIGNVVSEADQKLAGIVS